MEDIGRYQVSFVRNGELAQFDFLSTQRDADALRERLETRVGDIVVDLQVYRPGNTPTGVERTLDDVLTAADIQTGRDEDIDRFLSIARAAAREIDVLAAASPGGTRTLEFVWTNGGDDGNAYGQDIAVPRDVDTQAEHALERFQRSLDTIAADLGISGVEVTDRELLVPLDTADEAWAEVGKVLDIDMDMAVALPGR